MGRPSSYRGEYSDYARKLCRLGVTDEALADFFEVSVATLNRWKHAHPEFMESVKIGRTLADAEVAERLFQRACGYSHVATKFVTHKGIITDREEYVKHYPPDTQACIFWLKNRRPDLWREKVEIEPNRDPIIINNPLLLTEKNPDEEFKRFIADTRERQRLEKEEEEEEQREQREQEQQRKKLEKQAQQRQELELQEQRRREIELEKQQQQDTPQNSQQETLQDTQQDSQQNTQQIHSEVTPEGTRENTQEFDPIRREATRNLSPSEKQKLRNDEMIRAWKEEMAERQRQHEEDCSPADIRW